MVGIVNMLTYISLSLLSAQFKSSSVQKRKIKLSSLDNLGISTEGLILMEGERRIYVSTLFENNQLCLR